MRQLERERRGIFFAEYLGKTEVMDEEGRHTGEWRLSYGKPMLVVCTVSPRRGNVYSDGFGIGVDCDRTAICDRIGIGISETSIIWVDKMPMLDEFGDLVVNEDGEPVVPNDYKVQMVSESYNYTAIAMKKAQ